MIFSFKYSAGILMALMAIDMPTQSNALSMVECADAYQIDGDDTMAEMQQKMMAFLFNPANCPVSGPTSETPECCFITPPLTRITADEAFDAYQTQTIRGKNGVIMVDVRTPEELYWTGQPAQVNKITLKHGDEFTPTNYRSTLRTNGGGNSKLVSSDGITFKADQVESVDLSPIAFSIPVEYRNVTTDDKSLNNEFGANMLSLFSSFPGEAAIFFCRSGKRSSVGCYIHYCTELLQVAGSGMTFYEVDAVDEITGDEKSGNGGFEGSTYSNKYLGYRGFPGRLKVSPYSAVDFKDSGLPIIIGKTPQTLEAHNDMSPPYKCLEDDTYSICQSSMFS